MSVHLDIVQGVPFRFLVRVQTKDETGALVPVDLTDSYIHLQVRPSVRSPELFLDLSSSSDGIEIGEEPGTFSIILSAEETSALDWPLPAALSRARFECKVTPPDGDAFRALEGTMSLEPELVRDG